MKRDKLLWVWIAVMPPALWAQQPQVLIGSKAYVPHQVILHAETNLVQVAVVVRDSRSRPVPGLTESDFKLYESGKQQTITGFYVEASPPAAVPNTVATAGASRGRTVTPPVRPQYVALFFDDKSMGGFDLERARFSAEKYLSHPLARDEQVGVFTSTGSQNLAFTDDRDRALAVVRHLGLEVRMGPSDQFIGPFTVNPYIAYMAVHVGKPYRVILAAELYKANLCASPGDCLRMAADGGRNILDWFERESSDSFTALEQAVTALGHQPGRRELLLTSGGLLSASPSLRLEKEALIKTALENGVVINTLDATLLQTDDPASSPATQATAHAMEAGIRDSLRDIAAGTGGEFFSHNTDVAGALAANTISPSVRYLLSFTPPGMKADGVFHPITVKLADGVHGEVEARKGYYDSAPEQDAFAVLPQQLLDRELLGGDAETSLAARTAFESATAPGGKRRLIIVVHVDAARLPFVHHDGRSDDTVGFATAVFDAQGKFVVGKQGVMELRVTKVVLRRFEKVGLGGNLSLNLPPGVYRLRELVREANHGELTLLTRTLDLK